MLESTIEGEAMGHHSKLSIKHRQRITTYKICGDEGDEQTNENQKEKVSNAERGV